VDPAFVGSSLSVSIIRRQRGQSREGREVIQLSLLRLGRPAITNTLAATRIVPGVVAIVARNDSHAPKIMESVNMYSG